VQRIAAEREPLARLLGTGDSSQPGKIGRMFAKLTDGHSRRMDALGLARGTTGGAANRSFRAIRTRVKDRNRSANPQ